MITLKSIIPHIYRYPLETPVQTSFGIMADRPMLLVRIEDTEGYIGWGEVWCNFPSVGAEHRAKLIDTVISQVLMSREFNSSTDVFDTLTRKTWVLGIQSGEYGPLAQCIAGIDIAVHDLIGKKLDLPIWKMLGGKTDTIPVYASGINPNQAKEMAQTAMDVGINNLKLKIGFGDDIDLNNLSKLRELIGPNAKLMADVNQGWSINEACSKIIKLEEFNLYWLEEPIAADRPLREWQVLKNSSQVPLAGGENIVGVKDFKAAIKKGVFSYIQPDLAKWGGFTQCVPIARSINLADLTYCPHYLGGGLGLIASGHALAAVGGSGMLEVDLNENPLRTELISDLLKPKNGTATLGTLPGLGIEPNLSKIARYKV